ncbi:hypothetical protein Q5752_000296 [Cryptotrichosporon argae]
MPTIGLFNGSPRAPSNTSAIVAYVQRVLSASHPSLVLDVADLVRSPGHPLPPTLVGLPAARTLADVPAGYDEERLFPEWAGMHAALVTLGGAGGANAQTAIRAVLDGTHMASPAKRVEITLEQPYAYNMIFATGDEEWLAEYEGDFVEAVNELLALVDKRQGAKAAATANTAVQAA